jgi:hypothetical protein
VKQFTKLGVENKYSWKVLLLAADYSQTSSLIRCVCGVEDLITGTYGSVLHTHKRIADNRGGGIQVTLGRSAEKINKLRKSGSIEDGADLIFDMIS